MWVRIFYSFRSHREFFFFFGVANELISITIPSFVVVVALISADNYTNMGFTLMTDDALSFKELETSLDSIHHGARYLLMNTIGNESPVSPRRRSKTKRDGMRKGCASVSFKGWANGIRQPSANAFERDERKK